MSRGLLGDVLSAVAPSRPRNDSPVPVVSRRGSALLPASGGGVSSDALGGMTATGTVFAIVDALAEGVSMVDWRLWRTAPSGKDEDRVEVSGHAFLDMMQERGPNPFTSQQELIEVGQQHIELVGEAWMALTVRAGYPIEIWNVRPDRMQPVMHPTKFLTGYIYNGPDGDKVPLSIEEVEMIRLPNPVDPYRGAGALQSVLIDADTARYSAEWNRNFFLNSAEPGGIIEVPPDISLSDDEFNEMRQRWREQHQGVSQAHRVAILEHGKWVDRKFTMRDMQFAELRGVSREIIREAWRFPKPILGSVDDVNRAVAEAMNSIFSQWLLVPRLQRWKSALNNILRRFPTGRGLVYDYESPVPADREADRNDMTAKASAAKALVDAGYQPQEVCAAVGLPIMSSVARAPDAVQAVTGALEAAMRGEFAQLRGMLDAARREVIVMPTPAAIESPERRVARVVPPARDSIRNLADLAAVQADWEAAVEDLLATWESETLPAQYADVEVAVRAAVESADVASLAGITVGSLAAAEALTAAMLALAERAATQAVGEAVTQGVVAAVPPPEVPAGELAAAAAVTASLLAAGVAMSATGEALRLFTIDAPVDEIVSGVRAHLDSLTDAQPRLRLGAALTAAQNAGRAAAFRALPVATYYASEENDSNTCGPCEEIHGTAFETLSSVLLQYPNGGYRKCEGRQRCRGTFVAKWGDD